MRKLRNFKTERCYHLISRVAHRAYFLSAEERSLFVALMWRVAAFSGVEVLAYCMMSNHFHILVHVPEREEITDGELFRRLGILYSDGKFTEIKALWNQFVRINSESAMEEFRKQYLRRMWDASEFMKTLKQHFTMSYNGRHMHTGTMWESRFRVREYFPDDKAALMKVAGYIDRNPLKAKLVGWPDQYEWCSFAAACKGDRRCIDGYGFIYSMLEDAPWEKIKELHETSIHEVYRELQNGASGANADGGASGGEGDCGKARERKPSKAEREELPLELPNILEQGSNKIAIDILKFLSSGKKKPSEIRESVNIASARFFTSYYLTPLEEKGFINISGGCNRFSPNKTFEITSAGEGLLREVFG